MIRENKKISGQDWLWITVLLVVYVFLVTQFWGYQGSSVSDGGRETFFPIEIIHGKILYKDLFNLFFPFSYEFNALLFKLFSINTSVLFSAGATTGFLIVICCYTILRSVIKPFHAAISSFLIICTSCFSTGYPGTYLFPYAYAMLYGDFFTIAALLGAVYTIKLQDDRFAYLTFLFAGLTLATKIDFVPACLFLSVFCLLYKRSLKKLLLGSILLIAPMTAFMGQLWIQGLTWSDLQHWWVVINHHARTPSNLFLNARYIGTVFYWPGISLHFKLLFKAFRILYVGFGTLYGLWFILHRVCLKLKINCTFSSLMPVMMIAQIALVIIVPDIYWAYRPYIMMTIPAAGMTLSLVALVYFGWQFKKNAIQKTSTPPLSSSANALGAKPSENLILKVTLIWAILYFLRCIFYINIEAYGPYLMPGLLIAIILFSVIVISPIDSSSEITIFKKVFCTYILFISTCCIYGSFIIVHHYSYLTPLQTPIGLLPLDINTGKTFARSYHRFQKLHLKTTDSVLVMPEGVILNVLLNKSADGWMYDTAPSFVETFGDLALIQMIQTRKPTYILIDYNRTFTEFKKPDSFGDSFAQSTVQYIKQHYRPLESISGENDQSSGGRKLLPAIIYKIQ